MESQAPSHQDGGPSVWTSLSLTLLGAAGTTLGGILVVLRPEMSLQELGMLQSFSAGLMLCLSCMELMPVSIGVLGFGYANLWFFAGVVFFACVVELIPEPEIGAPRSQRVSCDPLPSLMAAEAAEAAERLSTLSLDPVSHHPATPPPLLSPQQGKEATSCGGEGGGGAKGPPEAPAGDGNDNGQQRTPSAVRRRPGSSSRSKGRPPGEQEQQQRRRRPDEPPGGASGSEAAGPREGHGGGAEEEEDDAAVRRRVMFSGLVTAVGIALHNFPEGVAVLLASLKSSQVGLSVAMAIALHNVPEGVAVALPVYYATKSRWQALLYAIAGGLAEPLAVLLCGGVFLPAAFDGVDPQVLEAVMAGVAGIMAYLSLHELLPLALSHVSKQAAVHSLFAGMAVMSLNLFMLEVFTEGIEGV